MPDFDPSLVARLDLHHADVPPTAQSTGGGRPGVLSMTVKDRTALYSAYMPFLTNGGLFVPTDKGYLLGDETYLILTLPGSATKHVIPGRVAWVTAPGSNGRTPGIGIHFGTDAVSKAARRLIEHILGGVLSSSRPTLTL